MARGFTPYAAPGPNSQVAAGYYDPALLAALTNAQTGYARLVGTDPSNPYGGDTGTALSRITQQLGFDTGDVNRQAGYAAQDAQTGLQRGTQDHDTALADLARNYKMLAGQQLQSANAAGVLRGGALEQAAGKRAANQAHDQQPIDTAFQRGQQDIQTGASRASESATAALARLSAGAANSRADLTHAADYAHQDLATFGRQTQDQIGYQASQGGWQSPASRPSNEFTNPQGQTYQVRIEGHDAVAYLPSGQVLWRRPASGR